MVLSINWISLCHGMKITKFHLKYAPLKYHFPSVIFKSPTKHNVALLIYPSSVWTSWKHDCHLSRNSCHLKRTLRENAQKTMAAIVIYQIIQHNEAVSKSHDIYSRINSSPQAIKMLALSSAALLAPLHTLSLHNDWLHSIIHHISTLQESLISNMSPFILKHQRFVTGTWRICLQRNGSGQIDLNLLNLAHWKHATTYIFAKL